MRKYVFLISVGLWLIGIGGGSWMMWDYENTPGQLAEPPLLWPAASRIPLNDKLPTLVMFAHPHRPCTRASIEELSVLAAQVGNSARLVVEFLTPIATGQEWVETDLWRSAVAIPGARVMKDSEGREASLFHAATSGSVLLYDAKGHLLFNGGITAARGHAGDNVGRSTVTAILSGQALGLRESLVFGCPLFNPEKSSCPRCHVGEQTWRFRLVDGVQEILSLIDVLLIHRRSW